MFDHAEADPTLDPATFDRLEKPLRTELVLQQYQLLERRDRAILLVIAGIDGAGKGATINLLNEWLDPRHVRTLAFGQPTHDQQKYPALWRYWRALPERGKIGVVFGSWYAPLLRRAYAGRLTDQELLTAAERLRRFEALLAAEGVVVVKLWYHLSREAQQARCERLDADPDTAWQVTPADRRVVKRFTRIRRGAERVLRATDHVMAPWHVVPSADERCRIATTAQQLQAALTEPLPVVPPVDTFAPAPDRLSQLDDSTKLDKPTYQQELLHWQGRLSRAVRTPQFQSRALVLVFEGDDAAGKGGTIRRITHALDVRQYRIIPVGVPTDEERARPYLWRFWRHAPRLGEVRIFDRSWYGRVLIERVEKLVSEAQWRRAYDEIVEFEREWVEHGAIMLKFWLAITQEEQLKRFHDRERSPFKRFKLTDDDWRNRELNPQYRAATSDMLEYTDHAHAPWHIVATDSKRRARIDVLRTLVERLEAETSPRG